MGLGLLAACGGDESGTGQAEGVGAETVDVGDDDGSGQVEVDTETLVESESEVESEFEFEFESEFESEVEVEAEFESEVEVEVEAEAEFEAGVHLYERGLDDDALAVSRNLIGIHARTPGTRAIYLPSPADVSDALTGASHGASLFELRLTLTANESRILLLRAP